MSEKFEHIALPNLQELQQFHEGALAPERMREIRAIADENPLVRESLEGYAASGVFLPMPTFEQTGLAQLKIASSASDAAASTFNWKVVLKPWAWTTTTKIVVGVAIATGLVLGVVKTNDKPAVTQVNGVQQQEGSNKELNNTGSENSATHSSNPTGLEDNNLTTNNSVDQSSATESTFNATPVNDSTAVSSATKTAIPGEIPPLEPTFDPFARTEEDRIREQRKGLIMVGMTEILKYRVADYTDVRREKWSNVIFSEGHTPANQERHGAVPKEQEQNSLRYLDYVGHCISYLDNKQYKQAKEGFDALQKLYTDDVNAQFYGGLTRYRSGDYAAAIPLFKMTETNAMRAFREDAKFYRAMAMKSNGQAAEAKILFEEIAASGGAYAKRALEEMHK